MAKKKAKSTITIEMPYVIPAQEVMVSIEVPLKDVEALIKEHKKGK